VAGRVQKDIIDYNRDVARAPFGGLLAEYKKEDETLDEDSASGIVARSL
jgi:hypothetical protein